MSHATFGKWDESVEESRRLHNRDVGADFGVEGLASYSTNESLAEDIRSLAAQGFSNEKIAEELGCNIFDVEEVLGT